MSSLHTGLHGLYSLYVFISSLHTGLHGFTQYNAAPMFHTARRLVAYVSQDAQEMIDYNQAMLERFKIRHWLIPLPMQERRVDFPRCGPCLESAT
jgi:hypothetical protein